MNGLDEGLSPIPGSHRHKLFQVVKLVKVSYPCDYERDVIVTVTGHCRS